MYGEKKTLSARKETFKKRKLSHSLFVPSIVLGCSLFDYLSVGVFILFLFLFFVFFFTFHWCRCSLACSFVWSLSTQSIILNDPIIPLFICLYFVFLRSPFITVSLLIFRPFISLFSHFSLSIYVCVCSFFLRPFFWYKF